MTSGFSKYRKSFFSAPDYFLHFIIISIILVRSDGDNDKMKKIIEYSTKNDFRYLEKSEVIF